MRGWGCEGDFAATISFSKKENTECVSDPLEITPETKQENPMAIKISSIFMFAITQELSGSGFIPNQLEYNNKARSSKTGSVCSFTSRTTLGFVSEFGLKN